MLVNQHKKARNRWPKLAQSLTPRRDTIWRTGFRRLSLLSVLFWDVPEGHIKQALDEKLSMGGVGGTGVGERVSNMGDKGNG